MYFTEHSAKPWPTRRAQRCLTFAVIFAFILIAGVYERRVWQTMTQRQLDTVTGLHKYTSSPEAGMPSLPFKDNSIRKATEEPFFIWEDQQEELAGRDEPPPQEGTLIGLH